MRKALAYLNNQIEIGMEYPDAEWATSQKFGVDCEALRAEYDNQST